MPKETTGGINLSGGRDVCSSSALRLLDLQKLDIEDERAIRGDTGDALASVCKVGGDCETTLTADRHAHDTDVPALDDLALTDLEGERRTLLVGVEDLAVLELSDIAHANLVAVLDGAASADLSVVNGDARDDLDTTSSLLPGVLGGAGRALLEVLGELNLLVTLGGGLLGLGLLSGNSLTLVGLELLLLLLAELLLVLGDHLVKALGLLFGSALLALLGRRYKLGGLILTLDLLDAGGTIDVVELIALVVRVLIHHVLQTGREVVVVLILIIRLVIVRVGDNVVSGKVDAVGARYDKEDLLSLGDDNVDGLLEILQSWLA